LLAARLDDVTSRLEELKAGELPVRANFDVSVQGSRAKRRRRRTARSGPLLPVDMET
jgi:hypothetical protein